MAGVRGGPVPRGGCGHVASRTLRSVRATPSVGKDLHQRQARRVSKEVMWVTIM